MNRHPSPQPTPPRVAMWLLTRLTPAERRAPIIGDLVERFSEGETRRWFWSQTAHVLATALFNGLRRHTPSAVGALMAAYGVLLAFAWIDPMLQRAMIHWQSYTLFEIDPHWRHNFFWTAVIQQVANARPLVWFLAAGWIASRIHRAHPRTIACIVAGTHVVMMLPWTIRLIQNAMTHPRYLDALGWHLMTTLTTTLTIAIAGFIPTLGKRPVTDR